MVPVAKTLATHGTASIVAEKIQCRVDDLLRATARAEERHFWFRGFRWFVRPLVHRALAHKRSPRASTAAAAPVNLHLLTPFGAAYGFDLSAVGLQIGHGRAGAASCARPPAAVPFAGNAFDLVTSFDVLYALDDNDRARRGGGDVPASRGRAATRSSTSRRCRCCEATIPFSATSVAGIRADLSRQLIASAGFRIERLTYTNAVLFLPMLAVRLFHRARGLSTETDATSEIAVPPAPVNAPLSALAVYRKRRGCESASTRLAAPCSVWLENPKTQPLR